MRKVYDEVGKGIVNDEVGMGKIYDEVGKGKSISVYSNILYKSLKPQ